MVVYSHTQLSAFEGCPQRYRLTYRDRIKRDQESVEAFTGKMVHDTLKKCYDDIRLTKVNALKDLLAFYKMLWQQHWHEAVIIMRQDITAKDYLALGEKMLETYYERHSPFDADRTIGTEVPLSFSLDDSGTYRVSGFIDRLSRARDGAYQIHDYKTSAYLPSQHEADSDRQLGLYQLGLQKKWPRLEGIRLIWHYLAFDAELISYRTPAAISRLVLETKSLIDEIESAQDFPPKESRLCEWCEYPDLCPRRKHLFKVEALPPNEYLNEPGVVLVDQYVKLKEKASAMEAELGKVREAILDYARREGAEVIRGSTHKARVNFDEKLKFPGKNEGEHQELAQLIREAGKWQEVSQLDMAALTRVVEENGWSKELIDKVMKYGRIDESSSIHLSELKDEP